MLVLAIPVSSNAGDSDVLGLRREEEESSGVDCSPNETSSTSKLFDYDVRRGGTKVSDWLGSGNHLTPFWCKLYKRTSFGGRLGQALQVNNFCWQKHMSHPGLSVWGPLSLVVSFPMLLVSLTCRIY
jgi:hypothetical protein